MLTVLNSSVNFYIYLAKHGRQEMRMAFSSRSNRTESGMVENSREIVSLELCFDLLFINVLL